MTARSIPVPEKSMIEEPKMTARPINLSPKEISRFRSLVSAPLKGLIKELPSIAKLHDPVAMFLPNNFEEKFIKEKAEEFLPTQPEFAEKALERFGHTVPYLAGSGLAGVARAGLGALAAQSAEELGVGPVGQSIAEMGAFAGPGLARKIIPSGKEQKALIDTARKYGMTEEQIAPLIPGKFKRQFFGKFASKGEDTQEILKETRKGISDIYNVLKKGPESSKKLSEESLSVFANEMNELGKEMPHAIRSQLKNDALDLVNSARKKGGVDVEELINFFQDISSRYNVGKEQLQRFKNPVKKALSSVSKDTGEDFDLANKMWQRQLKIGETLYPGQYENLVDLGESYALAAGIASGDMGLLKKVLGAFGARRFAKAMLTNPRLQNISQKTIEAIQENNLPLVKKLGDLAKYELEKKED